MYVVKYDSIGNVLWANRAGGYSADYGNSIATDGNGNCYVIGEFRSSAITFGSVTLTKSEGCDIYVVKLDPFQGKFRTFSDSSSFATKAVKLKIKSNVVAGIPNEGTVLENVFTRAVPKEGVTLLGISTTDKIKAKTQGWLLYKKAVAVQLLYTSFHTGQSYPIDSIRKEGKKSKVLVKAITAARKTYSNPIWAQGVLLRLNIIASDYGITPQGFGYLLLDTSFILIGREVNGMSLRSVAAYLDSLMSLYATFGIGGTNTTDEYNNLGHFALLLNTINDGFYVAMSPDNYLIDTTNLKTGKKPYAVKLLGVKTPDEVGIVKYNPNGKQVQENRSTIRNEIPHNVMLQQNYPNPFNPKTVISYQLSVTGFVTMKIYNVLGQEVATLLNNEMIEEGEHEIEFDASNLSSGIYFYRLSVAQDGILRYNETKKLVLMK